MPNLADSTTIQKPETGNPNREIPELGSPLGVFQQDDDLSTDLIYI